MRGRNEYERERNAREEKREIAFPKFALPLDRRTCEGKEGSGDPATNDFDFY